MVKKLNKYEFEIIDILEMVNIVYSDGKKEFFKAIQILDNGVFTGRIINNDEFINGGFIPKQNIKKIIGGTERKIRRKKSIY